MTRPNSTSPWANRGNYRGAGYGYGGYGRGFGYGGFGSGFLLGSLLGYGLGGFGYGGYGYGGYAPSMYGTSLYDWGYSNYYNPYDGTGYGLGATALVQPTSYNYSQPISTTSPAPQPAVFDQAVTSFDSARDAFWSGDYARALTLVDPAIQGMPNDAVLHEFRALTLFALQRYHEAAAALYSVLSVGRGWDWTTLAGFYPNVSVYTDQLRALENYCNQNAGSSSAQFVLAYQYLTEGYTDAALQRLKRVVALQPKDTLSANLIRQLDPTAKMTSALGSAQPASSPPAPGAGRLVPTVHTSPGPAKEGHMEGVWSAQPDQQTAVTLTFQDAGHYTWKVAHQGQSRALQGKMVCGNGILTLTQQQGAPIVGNVTWQDETHFTFKVPGTGPEDPGLAFAKSS